MPTTDNQHAGFAEAEREREREFFFRYMENYPTTCNSVHAILLSGQCHYSALDILKHYSFI